MKQKLVDIVIGGDLCPRGINLPDFQKGDAKKIFNDLLFEFENADLTIVNLECPLIEQESPIEKCGPVLGVDSSCVSGIKNSSIDIVNLANNHIMDHGQSGLEKTLEICKNNNIETVGAGKNIVEARRIFIKDINGIRLGVLAVAEHEFSIATKNSYGANPVNLADTVRSINAYKKEFDYLIVLFHGGTEHYPYPSPKVKNTCEFMIEMGANAVILQHTHCPGCYQEYKKGHIVYGQGNLIFDSEFKNKSFHQGFLVKLSVFDNLSSQMEALPFIQSLSGPGAKKMSDEDGEKFKDELRHRSSLLDNESFVEGEWLKYCASSKYQYMNRLFGLNSLFSKLVGRGLFHKYLCTEHSLKRFQNTVSCESHREVVETLFNNQMIN